MTGDDWKIHAKNAVMNLNAALLDTDRDRRRRHLEDAAADLREAVTCFEEEAGQ